MLEFIYLFQFQLAALVILSSSISTVMMFLLFRRTKGKLEIWLNDSMENFGGQLGLSFKKGSSARGGIKSGQTRAVKAAETTIFDTLVGAFPEASIAQPILNQLGINLPVDKTIQELRKNPQGVIGVALKYGPLLPPEWGRDRVQAALKEAIPMLDGQMNPSVNGPGQDLPPINYPPRKNINSVSKLKSK